MCLAGTYAVTRSSKQCFFNPLQGMLDHMAQAESYVLRHSYGKDAKSEGAILHQLTIIDETIRGEWAKVLRSNKPEGVTMGEIVDSTKSYAAALWMMAPTEAQKVHVWQGVPPTSRAPAGKVNLWKGAKGKGKSKKGDSGKSGNQGTQFKTMRNNADGKRLCKPYNDSRGCSNPRCPDIHGCDIQCINECSI